MKNVIIEQDHRQVKKIPKSLGFQKMQTASAKVKGVEAVNTFSTGNFILFLNFAPEPIFVLP